MTRREMREQAFILVFEKMFNKDATIEELAEYAQECGLFEPTEFSMALAAKTELEQENIDGKVAKYSKNWSIARLPRVALAVLRLAVSEMLYFEEIPISVSINEAVELAKKYASNEDASYINGVLGGIARSELASVDETASTLNVNETLAEDAEEQEPSAAQSIEAME